MLDTTQMSVGEIRDVLVNHYGLDRNEVDNIKPKSAVVEKLKELEADDEILASAVEEDTSQSEESIQETSQNVEEVPDIDSPTWTNYVLGLMTEDELFENHPTVDGLRRIASALLGPIRSVTSKIVQSPDLNNNMHASVRVRVVTDDQVIDGSADAGGNNCKPTFAIHPVAMAESRAESRAYRRLLRLKNVISAEELVDKDQIIDEYEGISSTQIKMIDKICSTSNINVEKWLATHDIKLEDFKKTTKNKASSLCENLNSLRGSGTVPEEITGYSFGWQL